MIKLFQINKRFIYWPPKNKLRTLRFPSGKKSFIFVGKRDEDGKEEPVLCSSIRKKSFILVGERDGDGKEEPVLCFVHNQNQKLTWMNEEEVLNFEKLMPRLDSYFSLYIQKAQKVNEQNMQLIEEMHKTYHE
ncbi:hypothetical protein PFHG_04319 [Plasmodium falciparum HB3]|uniref:Uncharacterized protein n=1 Tax=Plasmodium falciparum (isolate HB3) TaxID=137071 RepID=A0A0L7KHI1_PLAFX|nr:hypothetical protein PFHG_04319 [Plasmodium falciparum HB3]